MKRRELKDIINLYQQGEKITCLSLYDACFAQIADQCDIPLILVGDSLGMQVLGYDSTIPVKISDCVRHTQAVVRSSKKAFIVADMPFLTYSISESKALENAALLLQDALANAIKIEGGKEIAPLVKKMILSGIAVMGHIGILPQHFHNKGYKIQGKKEGDKKQLLEDALALQEAGAFAIVLEGVEKSLSKEITQKLSIPTIGIGSGVNCDGEIQVLHDILGLSSYLPKHSKQYLKLLEPITQAIKHYQEEVINKKFPTKEN